MSASATPTTTLMRREKASSARMGSGVVFRLTVVLEELNKVESGIYFATKEKSYYLVSSSLNVSSCFCFAVRSKVRLFNSFFLSSNLFSRGPSSALVLKI